ncbi:hypothetical protein D0Z08_25920 [Nocardioides immobilis]|uniref:Uncharacterized protein n=1 Tax=Nocardioides immobilis TaxID=2049295 RepID=A0A417XUK4_9ACTN|nr:hypothetical protein [Nocardioides immobilis]RHW24159.1 hypothetical protein D0Z08_25920 [Nocardioides immobilis]
MEEISREVRLAAPMAEFEALRAEVLSMRGVQKNVISIALTAYAALFSVALSKDGDSRILWVVPPLGLVLCLFLLGEMFQIGRIGIYIRNELWPEIQRVTAYDRSWERRHDKRGWFGASAAAVVADGAVPLLLFGAGVVALCTMPQLGARATAGLWACAVLTFVAPIAGGLVYYFDSERHGRDRKTVTLWHLTDPDELDQVKELGMKAWPSPRRDQHPFLQVIGDERAVTIPRAWTKYANGAVYLTRFEVKKTYLNRRAVGRPSGHCILEHHLATVDDMEVLNRSIVGAIDVVAEIR